MGTHKRFIVIFWTMFLLGGALLLISSGSAMANQTLTNALRQAEKGNTTQAAAARGSLNGTALDTLNWYLYTKSSVRAPASERLQFLNKHSNWPYRNTIQIEAEKSINGGLDSTAAQFFNKTAPKTAKGMSAYLQSQGNSGAAKQTLNTWWQSASMSRDDQRKIFSSYSNLLTRQSHVKRLDALLNKREYSNASAIAAALGGGYPALARARQALAKGSGDVNGLINAVPANLQNDEGLLFNRLQWRRKKGLNQGAIEILNQSPPASRMSNSKRWWKERHIIVRRMMEAKQFKTAYRVASTHKQTEGFPKSQAEWISGFLALRFVDKPYDAFEHFEALYKNVKSPISRARGAYWAGRASEALNNSQVAGQWFNVAAKYPETFYGQLAGEKMGRVVKLNMRSASGAGSSNNSLGKAATYLSQAGLRKEAEAFLLRLKDDAKSTAQYEQAANLAERLGQQHIAIKIAQDLQKEKGVALGKYLYPQKVRELQNIRNVEWAFINAIIRQESRFNQYAVSSAGARGLMQLMPATARETASRGGVSHQKAWLTSRPSHNINLGSKYLGQMTRRYAGNYAMAAAAYNAGPGRVDKWIKQFGDPRRMNQDQMIDWAEQIPIYETRNYVQRVLEGVYVYRNSLQGKQPPVNAPIHVANR